MMSYFRAIVFGLLLLLAVSGSGWAADKDKPATAEKQKLPPAKEVLERYAKAIGGREAFLKHKSQRSIGAVQMAAQGVNGKMEAYAARPNKLLIKMTVPGIGDFNTGFDGKIGWMSSALTGPMLLQGKMLEQVSTQADFDHTLHSPADYKTLEVLGIEEFNGEECFKVKLVHRSGFDTTEYFSRKTGLQTGFISTQESPLGPVTATTLVTEYKQFGDLYLPSKISQKAAGLETVMTVSEMEFDKVDPAIFEASADVKALVEKPADKTDPTGVKKSE